MTSFEVWVNVMASLMILFGPILLTAGVLLPIGFKISDKIQSNILAFMLVIASILLVASLGVSWIQTLAEPCGYLERHFPTEDHIDGYCENP
jgi:hypothetical protein